MVNSEYSDCANDVHVNSIFQICQVRILQIFSELFSPPPSSPAVSDLNCECRISGALPDLGLGVRLTGFNRECQISLGIEELRSGACE